MRHYTAILTLALFLGSFAGAGATSFPAAEPGSGAVTSATVEVSDENLEFSEFEDLGEFDYVAQRFRTPRFRSPRFTSPRFRSPRFRGPRFRNSRIQRPPATRINFRRARFSTTRTRAPQIRDPRIQPLRFRLR